MINFFAGDSDAVFPIAEYMDPSRMQMEQQK